LLHLLRERTKPLLENVEKLLSEHVNAIQESYEDTEVTALHLACHYGLYDVCALFLQKSYFKDRKKGKINATTKVPSVCLPFYLSYVCLSVSFLSFSILTDSQLLYVTFGQQNNL
jgi:ankyrin repeat protein